MPQGISIRRIFGAITATGLIAGAIYCTLEYRRLDQEFFDWIDARPLKMSVDLSRPGQITAPFVQTCQISHGEAFYLTINPLADRNASDLLDGLAGTITINDSDGNEVQSLEIPSKIAPARDFDEPIMLAYIATFPEGEYSATIEVQEPAPALDGVEQSIHARYHLCGCERLPATVHGFFAFVCGIPGLVVALFVLIGFIRYGIATPRIGTVDDAHLGETTASQARTKSVDSRLDDA
jgi:hypothetical protein